MGLFDFFRGRKDPEPGDAPAEASSPAPQRAAPSWGERFAATRTRDFTWDYEEAPARALVTEFLESAAPHFAPAKVKPCPDDGNIDLRGVWEGQPIRFAVWLSFGSFWAIEMKAPMWMGHLVIQRDHEKIPKHKDADDPWSEDEDRRIFIAKGIFVEGGDDEVANYLSVWASLPEAERVEILAEMERLDGQMLLRVGDQVSFSQSPGLPDLPDPLAYMKGCAKLLLTTRRACEALSSTPPTIDLGAATAPVHRASCTYCSTLFLVTPGHSSCPNCGAPAQG